MGRRIEENARGIPRDIEWARIGVWPEHVHASARAACVRGGFGDVGSGGAVDTSWYVES